MSYTGDVDQLEELQPLDEMSEASVPQPGAAMGGILPAPAYHPMADKEYYRFLFAGVVMLIGCLMPFGPRPVAGYMTVRGAVFLIIALGVVWSSWASIANRRMIKGLLRWVMLAMVPFAVGLIDVLKAFDEGTAVYAWNQVVGEGEGIASWGEFFGELGSAMQPGDKVGEFLMHFGPGRMMVFFGAFLAEFFMVMAVFGGAKKMKEQKAERRASAGSRKR